MQIRACALFLFKYVFCSVVQVQRSNLEINTLHTLMVLEYNIMYNRIIVLNFFC